MTYSARRLPRRCKCGYVADSVSSLDGDAAPGPGDFDLCIGCGLVSIYGPNMILREATSDDDVPSEIERVREAILEMKRRRA